MSKYIKDKNGKVKPFLDKNIAFYFCLTPQTIVNYKKKDTAKYLELKKAFLEAWRTNKII